MVQDDDKIVLLDFGQCKALPAARQRALAQLIIAMDDGNELEIALAMSRFGMDFSALGGGIPDPKLIQTVAFIVFDTRSVALKGLGPPKGLLWSNIGQGCLHWYDSSTKKHCTVAAAKPSTPHAQALDMLRFQSKALSLQAAA